MLRHPDNMPFSETTRRVLNSYDYLISMHRILYVASGHKHILVAFLVRYHKPISASCAPEGSNLQIHFIGDAEPVVSDPDEPVGPHQTFEKSFDLFFFSLPEVEDMTEVFGREGSSLPLEDLEDTVLGEALWPVFFHRG